MNAKMRKNSISNHRYVSYFFRVTIIFLLSFIFLISFNLGPSILAKESSYIPAAPSGPVLGFINTSYNYTISTTDVDADWMFDWGDGNLSDWISLESESVTISQSHTWYFPDIYLVRVVYRSSYFDEIWSSSLAVNITLPNVTDHPNKPPIPQGKINGTININYSYSTQTIDTQRDQIKYRYDWGDGNISGWTSFMPSGRTISMSNSWKYSGPFQVRSQACDIHGLLSDWSDPLNVTIAPDSDRDGLSDSTELNLGSDPQNASDVIANVFNDTDYYIVVTRGEKRLLFFDETSNIFNRMESTKDGDYLIDVDDDGAWDYTYNPTLRSISLYSEPSPEERTLEIPWFWIIVGGIIGAVIFILFFLYKKGYIYLYEEYVVEE